MPRILSVLRAEARKALLEMEGALEEAGEAELAYLSKIEREDIQRELDEAKAAAKPSGLIKNALVDLTALIFLKDLPPVPYSIDCAVGKEKFLVSIDVDLEEAEVTLSFSWDAEDEPFQQTTFARAHWYGKFQKPSEWECDGYLDWGLLDRITKCDNIRKWTKNGPVPI